MEESRAISFLTMIALVLVVAPIWGAFLYLNQISLHLKLIRSLITAFMEHNAAVSVAESKVVGALEEAKKVGSSSSS